MSPQETGTEPPVRDGAGRRPLMRLFTHLLISHSAPVLVVSLALAVSLTALVRLSFLLTTLSDTELVTLRDEGTLHRTAWSLDVAMRHGYAACAAGSSTAVTTQQIQQRTNALATLLRSTPPGAMRDLAARYVAAAHEILSSNVCDRLTTAQLQSLRDQLDQQLTNLWVDRLGELHSAVAAKEDRARDIAVAATWTGLPLALASFLIAMLVARRMARLINQPLATLAEMAKRVGHGDFRTSVPVHGPAEIVALAGELERMRAQLQQVDGLKQGFLASVSHELRTPLSKIREALALLEDGAVGGVDARQQRVIQIARSACEREIRLVTTLLDLSRLRAGSPLRFKEGTSIDGVLQSALDDEMSEATARGVQCVVRTHGEAVACRLDPVLLERAVANLIRNAVAVSSPGQTVQLERFVESARQERLGRWIRMTVSDQGPGVPSSIRDQVFNPFVTCTVSGSSKTPGVGLGLALAREVALAHGGDLELITSEATGTTFQMWLPIEEPRRTQHPPAAPLPSRTDSTAMSARP